MSTNGTFLKVQEKQASKYKHLLTNTVPGQYLKNHFLIAMPQLQDPYFERTVTLICDHSEEGAMGIVINRPMDLYFGEVLEQLNLPNDNLEAKTLDKPVLIGGPVARENGLVLHKTDYEHKNIWDSTLAVSEKIHLTTSQDILHALAKGKGPAQQHFALGYSGWDAGQLEEEIRNNSWLITPVHESIVFDLPFTQRWEAAAQLIGIDVDKLSHVAGHA